MDDGQIDVASWMQFARFCIASAAVVGLFTGPLVMFRWLLNGKTRDNVKDLTPGLAHCCRENRERIIRLEAESSSNHDNKKGKK